MRNPAFVSRRDGIQQTMIILPKIIETLKKEGYHFVTIDEMIKLNKKASTP